MRINEKTTTYTSINSYSTLNILNEDTKRVWILFHGIGYLSRYFIRMFDSFNKSENYFIAPQAPSKYYKDDAYKKVGSSWLTKENTQTEIKNTLNYIDAVLINESIPENIEFVVLGYSQGVSIAGRWVAGRKIKCNNLILISGGFPKELEKDNFSFLSSKTKITHILGRNDPYFSIEEINKEKKIIKNILPNIEFITHKGGHELDIISVKDAL